MNSPRIHRLLPGALLPFFLVFNSAQSAVVHYSTELSGAAEAPPNASPGTGKAEVYFDDAALTLRIVVTFSNLIGTVTAAHIHAATALANAGTAAVATQVPTFPGFPSGVNSGFYDQTFDLTLASSFRPGYLAANGGTALSAANALGTALSQERAYLNVHTTAYPGGEIRGFLSVPETGSTALFLALGMLTTAAFLRGHRIRA